MSNDYKALKDRIDLAEEIKRRTGLTITPVGKILNLSECPFCGGHDCFRIDPEKQFYSCFQCGINAEDVFDFVRRHEKCDAKEALRILAKDHGYELTNQQPETSGLSPVDEKAHRDRAAIFEAAASYYHDALIANKQALGYQRGCRRHADDTLKAFRVGYADGGLLGHLTSQGFTNDQLMESGLVKIREGKPADFFIAGLYIYPYPDKAGRISGFTCKDPVKREKPYNYRLTSEHWGPNGLFFNMPAFVGKEIFLVEGENDLLSVHGRGEFHQVAAINGQISKEQIEFLANWAPGKTIYLCFDNDKAGQTYTGKVCQALEKLCLPATLARLQKAPATTERDPT